MYMRSFLLIGLLLSGCSFADYLNNTSGVGIPSTATVKSYMTQTVEESIIDTPVPSVSRIEGMMTPGQYLVASIGYTNEKCHQFFELLERFKQDSSLLDKVLTAASTASSPLMVAGGAPKSAVAGLTSALGFTNQLNKATAEIYAFATFKEQLKEHVFAAMTSFQQQKGLDWIYKIRTGQMSEEAMKNQQASTGQGHCRIIPAEVPIGSVDKNNRPETKVIYVDSCVIHDFFHKPDAINLMIARSIAADYAALCSLAHMKKIVTAVLEKTTTKTNPEATSLQGPTSTIAVAK